jgi:hypothetical protein
MASSLQPIFDVCSQCGLVHPPLQTGVVCPMRPMKSATGAEIDTSKFFATLKNIMISQIQKKNIINVTKLMNEIVIVNTKFLEEYKE